MCFEEAEERLGEYRMPGNHQFCDRGSMSFGKCGVKMYLLLNLTYTSWRKLHLRTKCETLCKIICQSKRIKDKISKIREFWQFLSLLLTTAA